MAQIELDQIRKVWDDVVAVDGMNLTIEDGEFVANSRTVRLRKVDHPIHACRYLRAERGHAKVRRLCG